MRDEAEHTHDRDEEAETPRQVPGQDGAAPVQRSQRTQFRFAGPHAGGPFLLNLK